MFITFEGSEGSGKTSQLPLLAGTLRQQGYAVLTTREPGGTPIVEQIRKVILDLKNTDMHPRTEILLFQAARAQHVEQVIRPHLDQGGIVLCDRFADSTLAYQGYGRQTDLAELRKIIFYATGGLNPDLTLLFDMDVMDGLRRRSKGGDVNRLDSLDLAFYERVRQGYLSLAAAEPQRWALIVASRSIAEVQAQVWQVVAGRLRSTP
ncbi:MAG: dTMP kinase [Anaerolineales bacterium]|jgi:dTMP kinase|nr:dTMP kinase [Anaerolineales bacterium]